MIAEKKIRHVVRGVMSQTNERLYYSMKGEKFYYTHRTEIMKRSAQEGYTYIWIEGEKKPRVIPRWIRDFAARPGRPR